MGTIRKRIVKAMPQFTNLVFKDFSETHKDVYERMMSEFVVITTPKLYDEVREICNNLGLNEPVLKERGKR